MLYLTFGVCLLLFLISICQDRKFYNPANLMFGLWSIILFLNMLSLYGINKASSKTYVWILLGLVSFFGGNWAGAHIHFPQILIKIGKKNLSAKDEINFNIFYFLSALTMALLTIDTIIAVRYMLDGNSLNSVRIWLTQTFEESTNPIDARKSYVEQVIRVVLIEPFLTALIPICSIDFFSKTGNKKVLITTIVITILNMLSTGGARLTILALVINILMGYAIYRDEWAIDISAVSKRRSLKIIAVIGIGGVLYLTFQRSSSGVIEEAYYYLAMCVPLLDYWRNQINTLPRVHGLLGLFGIIRIPFLILEGLGMDSSKTYNLAQEYILQANKFKTVGGRIGNSFVSPFYYLYADGGIPGIIIGMFLFGLFAAIFYRKVNSERKIVDVYIFLLLIQGILFTFIRWPFISTNYTLAFLFPLILFRRRQEQRLYK